MRKDLVAAYKEIEWESLLRTDLGVAGSLQGAAPVFKRIKILLDNVVSASRNGNLPETVSQEVDGVMAKFLTFINTSILGFTDVSMRGQLLNDINKTETEIIGGLYPFLAYISATKEAVENIGLDALNKRLDLMEDSLGKVSLSDESVSKREELLNRSEILAQRLLDNRDKFEVALERVDSLIERTEQVISSAVKDNASDSALKANEHKTFEMKLVPILLFSKIPFLNKLRQPSWSGSFPWLVSALTFGATSLGMIWYFIVTTPASSSISVGSSLLRISALIVPLYFTIFSAHQYLNHRRLYEAYRFKDLALQTMNKLRTSIPPTDSAYGEILTKSIEVIFTEPAFKEDVKLDKQIVLEAFKMIKKQ